MNQMDELNYNNLIDKNFFLLTFDDIKSSDFFEKVYKEYEKDFKRVNGIEKRKNCIIAYQQIKAFIENKLEYLAIVMQDDGIDYNCKTKIVSAFQQIRNLDIVKWSTFAKYKKEILIAVFKGLPLSDYDFVELIDAYVNVIDDVYKEWLDNYVPSIEDSEKYPKFVAKKIMEYINNN